MTKQKLYHSVSEMIADLSDSPEFVEAFQKQLAQRAVVKHLLVARAVQGLSQEEIAKKVNLTQSAISKFENGKDEDIRLGHLFRYFAALGLDAHIVVSRKGKAAHETLPVIRIVEEECLSKNGRSKDKTAPRSRRKLMSH